MNSNQKIVRLASSFSSLYTRLSKFQPEMPDLPIRAYDKLRELSKSSEAIVGKLSNELNRAASHVSESSSH